MTFYKKVKLIIKIIKGVEDKCKKEFPTKVGNYED